MDKYSWSEISLIVIIIQHSLEQPMCIKVINKQLLKKKSSESLKHEKRLLLKLNKKNNPFIIKLYSTFENRVNFIFLMEFNQGGNLEFHIQRLKRLTAK